MQCAPYITIEIDAPSNYHIEDRVAVSRMLVSDGRGAEQHEKSNAAPPHTSPGRGAEQHRKSNAAPPHTPLRQVSAILPHALPRSIA